MGVKAARILNEEHQGVLFGRGGAYLTYFSHYGHYNCPMDNIFEADRRDLFPLPLMFYRNGLQGCSSSQRRRRCKVNHNITKVNAVIESLNEMYGTCSTEVSGGCAPSAAQEMAQHEIFKQVRQGCEHVPVFSQREAMQELLHSTPSYSKEVETTVRPFSKDLVSLPVVGATPPQIDGLLDPVGRELLKDPISTMMLSPQEWGEVVEQGVRVKPYMDTILQHDSRKYQEFVHDLYKRGMVHFTDRPKDRITPFFVLRLRLVLDCRAVNQRFRDPPALKMAAGSTWSNLELPPGQTLYVAQSDIKDYFYSLPLPSALQPYFCLPPVSARCLADWGVPAHHGGDSCAEGLAHPMFVVTPMGSSWAMYWAQRIHSYQALLGAGLDQSREVAEGCPCPDLGSGEPVMITYADNLNIAGTDRDRVQQAKDSAVKHLRQCGFVVHEELDATSSANSLGFHIDGIAGKITPIPAKVGKVISMLRCLAGGPRVSGKMVEKLIGHCVHFMMLRRELLSIFRSLYQFVQDCYLMRRRLWPSARAEARWAANLLSVAFADLRRPWDNNVFASDASLSGIGICTAVFSREEVAHLGRHKENWRFKCKAPVAPRKSTVSYVDPTAGLDPFKDIETVKPCALAREDPYEINELFPEIPFETMAPEKWSLVFAARMKYAEPITVLEFRGILASLRHKFRSRSSFGKKHLHFNDNLSAVLCAWKGRSSSYLMLRAARRLCSLLIATNCQLCTRWIPSEWNVADHGSRLWEHERVTVERAAKKYEKQLKKEIDVKCYPNSVRPSKHGNAKAVVFNPTIEEIGGSSKAARWPNCRGEGEQATEVLEGVQPTSPISGTDFSGANGSQQGSGDRLHEENVGLSTICHAEASAYPSYHQVGCELQRLSESSFRRRAGRLRRLQVLCRSAGQSSRHSSKSRVAKDKKMPSGMVKGGPSTNAPTYALWFGRPDCL